MPEVVVQLTRFIRGLGLQLPDQLAVAIGELAEPTPPTNHEQFKQAKLAAQQARQRYLKIQATAHGHRQRVAQLQQQLHDEQEALDLSLLELEPARLEDADAAGRLEKVVREHAESALAPPPAKQAMEPAVEAAAPTAAFHEHDQVAEHERKLVAKLAAARKVQDSAAEQLEHLRASKRHKPDDDQACNRAAAHASAPHPADIAAAQQASSTQPDHPMGS